jgi:hypothetical protein
MERFYRRWDEKRSIFGDVMVVGFVLVQAFDGAFTYLGVRTWGPAVEANPIVSSVVAVLGLLIGLAAVKMFAVGLGILLHLRRVHMLVAFLNAVYLAVAILPWATMFLVH